MKKQKSIFTLGGVACAILLLSTPGNAVSSTADASSVIHWDNLSYSGSASIAYWNGNGQGEWSGSYVWLYEGQLPVPLPDATLTPTPLSDSTYAQDGLTSESSTVPAFPEGGWAFGSAFTDNADLYTSSYATSSLPGEYYSAAAEARRQIYYDVQSAGAVSFALPYELSSAVSGLETSVYTQAWAKIFVWDGASWQLAGVSSQTSPNSSGVLELSTNFSGSGYGLVELGVFTAAEAGSPVPVPGAVFLFGSGLIGLIGLRRKYRM